MTPLGQIRDKIRGCLVGVAIGDAIGMPVETMTPEEIRRTVGTDGVKGMMDSIQPYLKAQKDLKAGDTTDDWQLTAAVAESLIACRGFDLRHQARQLALAYRDSTVGWGRATKMAGAKFDKAMNDADGMIPNELSLVAPEPTPENPGCGNGIAMKIAPLGLWQAIIGGTADELRDNVLKLGLLTHGDPRASHAALAVATIIENLLGYATPYWHRDCLQKKGPHIAAINAVLRAEQHNLDFRPSGDDKASSRIIRATQPTVLESAESIRAVTGTGCFCLESVPLAIALSMRYANDFKRAVLLAVNAGGDTDTTASMVGAMVGVNVGLSGIPLEWQQAVPNVKNAISLADQLFDLSR